MITFLPSPSFRESAGLLDNKRLGNQRVEARMILRWLRDPQRYARQQAAGYTAMWRGFERALGLYYNEVCAEFARRGGRNVECTPEDDGWIFREGGVAGGAAGEDADASRPPPMPPWLGDERLHASHRAALLAKDLQWYGQHGWGEEPRVEYLWPRWTGAAGGEYRLGLSKAAAKARSAAAEAAEAAEAKQLRRSRRQNTAGGVAAAPPSLDSFRFTKRARQSL